MQRVFSDLEVKVAISILQGATLTECASTYLISKPRCYSIVNKFCAKSNRNLYDTIRSSQFEYTAPLAKLRKQSKLFLEGYEKLQNVTLTSTIWSLPNVPLLTLNALELREINTIEKLINYDVKTLKRFRFIGKVGLDKLQKSLNEFGFTLKE